MSAKKERLDVILVMKGLFESRERAKRAIMAGLVVVDGKPVDKAGTKIPIDSEVAVKEDPLPYVGRGGLKLEKALTHFGINVSGKKAVDVGASTGGFTDCLLKSGAKKVFAIDVGYGQLDWKLRNDSRVTVMERTNIRYVKPEDITEQCDIAVIDVAFISLTLVILPVIKLLSCSGEIVALIKPQFEAGREKVGKKGIVRDPQTHITVIEKVTGFLTSHGMNIRGITYSPITGSDGNIEYLVHAAHAQGCVNREYNIKDAIRHVVNDAHYAHRRE